MHRRLLASLALLVLPASAGAERLLMGGRAETFWTDNVFGVSEDALDVRLDADVVDDWAARVSPWADYGDYDGDVTWGVRYAPSYEYYLDQSELRGFDHDVGGRMSWRFTPRSSLTLSDRFRHYHNVTSFNEENDETDEIIGTVGQRQTFNTNTISGSLVHELSSRNLLTLSVLHNDYDYTSDELSDREYISTSLGYDHRVSERLTLGSRLSWDQQTVKPGEPDSVDAETIDPIDPGPDFVTNYFNLSGVLEYQFSPTLELELSGGPTLIQSDVDDLSPAADFLVSRFPLREEEDGFHFLDADTCERSGGFRVVSQKCKSIEPALTNAQLQTLRLLTANNTAVVPFAGLVPSVDDTSTTYFANVRLLKRWERWNAEVAYVRSASQSATVAGLSDFLLGRVGWQFARRWTADLSAGYERREQANENVAGRTVVANAATPVAAFPVGAESQQVRALDTDSSAQFDILTANLRVSYQLSQRSSLYGNVEWREEKQRFDVFEQNADRLVLLLGVNYSFDPINF